MESYKADFIQFMVRCDVLRFGDFTAKSGRKTPYFVDAGRYRSGRHLSQLARFYAQAIQRELKSEFDVLFGPAYKGIPLAAVTALALFDDHGLDVGYCFNRKEQKDHGEGGLLVGHPLHDGDRVLIIEDVTTAGTSIRETLPILQRTAAIRPVGLVVSVDRLERGTGSRNALAELAQTHSLKAFAIVTIDEIIAHLRAHPIDGRQLIDVATYQRVLDYRAQYGGSA
jgi:orotate phosphoribosyltransferase